MIQPIFLNPGLYIVATPIGNLRDITLRALDVLASAHLIACEDTRVTDKLLSHYGIHASLHSYNDRNAAKARPFLLRQLLSGKTMALVSDAGTPLISDPGYKLTREAAKANIPIYAVPGPSALTAALSIAALPTDRFFFAGFPPPRSAAQRTFLDELTLIPSTLVFFESAVRLVDALQAMVEILGNREAAVIREITKLYEETQRGTLSELIIHYQAHKPKGEIVIAVAPQKSLSYDTKDIDEALRALLKTMPLKDAAKQLATITGLSKKELYERALHLKPR